MTMLPDPRRWWVLATVSSALLLIVIDMTVLYTALPRLTHDLHATASEKLWIINAYGLVISGLLLGMGPLGDRLGHRRLFLAGLVVFGLASLGAAFAPKPAVLIGARAALAVGAAMMMPATLSLIRLSFSDTRERALAIGIWASVASGGAALGPVVGGVLLEHFWWGSVFLINVPIVLLAIVATLWLVPARPGNPARRWDLVGSLQAMAGLMGLAYAVKELGKREPALGVAALAFAVGALALVVFARRQRRSDDPMIDLAIFRLPGFGAAVVAALVAAIALMGVELALTQRLQLVLGMSPLAAGLYLLPLPLAAFVAGPVAGRLLPVVGSRRLLTGSLLLAGLGVSVYAVLHTTPGTGSLAALVAAGLGVGAAFAAASSTIMDSAPPERAGMAASLEEVSIELGGAMGVTLMGSLLAAVYSRAFVVPAELGVPASVRDSLDEALMAAEYMPQAAAHAMVEAGRLAFDQAFMAVLIAAAAVLLVAGVTLLAAPFARFRRWERGSVTARC
ncbi:MFS transporter [Achromobacter sp. GG226]|uniref:MFS transporter n=1 Tax=Verticiella alkaliphila TaxID=2779529 RepID=UPI001C0C7157|nr:MFS transporter [Verticiella sp. GG226]MBU4611099.1 MFS transporter [Verticiella sp. GG226]